MARCPYCEKEVTLKERDSSDPSAVRKATRTIWALRKEVMYSCPHCEKVLGFATPRIGVLGRL